MKILITGGNGFVGRNLLPKLIDAKYDILQVTTDKEKSQELYGNSINRHYYQRTNNELKKVVMEYEPEAVIHLASFLTANDDTATMKRLLDTNIFFLCELMDALKESGIKWFLNTGSFAEFYKGDGVFDPAYLYTATKTASRIFVDYYSKAYDFNYMTIAPYTIYGGIDTQKKIIDIIYDSLDNDETISLTPGNQVLDFIHIKDVTDFYITCLSNLNSIPNMTSFQLGTGKGHTLREIVQLMEKFTSKKANINWGGKSYRPRDVMYAVADISQQQRMLNWNSKTSLEEGISIYLKNKLLNEVKTEN
jgi:nucleoside-diphosphate-sugar epimerase